MRIRKRSAKHSTRGSLRNVIRLLPRGTPRSWAFLAGSGISVPSGLPTAWKFNERIATFLGSSAAEKRHISSLLTTGQVHSQKELRFEQVIEILREIGGDKDLTILDTFDDPGPPSDLHFFLAHMLRRRATVMTTNFDSLIERAFLIISGRQSGRKQRLLQVHLESDRSGRSRSTFRWYAAQRRLGLAVLKLHGTLRAVATQVGTGRPSFTANTARASVGATLDALGRAASSPGLEPMKDKVLRRVVRGRTLCVLGYSGSDDFDVLPSLARAAFILENIVWIRHAPGRTRIYLSPRATAMLPGILSTITPRGRVVLIEGNTLAIVRSLFGARATTLPARVLTPISTATSRFETLRPYVGMTPSRKLTIRGYLEETALALRAAQHTYTRATVMAKRERDIRAEVFSLARLGQLARVRGQLTEAARFLRRAQGRLADVGRDHRLAATVFLATGNVALDQTAWPEARFAYRQAITHAKRAGWLGMEATALNNLGLVYRRQGRLSSAKRYILRSLQLDRRLRRRSAIARDLGNLGIIAHEQGNYREALRYGKEALILDRDMGNNATLTTKRVDVAFALLRLRRYAEATKELNVALRLARKYERREDEARCWSARGLLHLQQGHFSLSIKCHERALTIFRSIRRREAIAHELLGLGDARRSAGDGPAARQCFSEALRLFCAIRNHRMVGVAKRNLVT